MSNDSKDENNEETSSQKDLEWDVLHTDTLTRYTINYPEQATVFQALFENIQVLRNTINNSSTRSDRYSDKVLVVFRNIEAISYDIKYSTGTVARKK